MTDDRSGRDARKEDQDRDSGFDFGTLLTFAPTYIVLGTAAALFSSAVRSNLLVGGLVLGGLISLYAYMTGRERDEYPDAGDNCYFIGFVFTLVVIAASIYFDLSADHTAADFDRLIKSVSVALSTSIFGMFLRFVINHGAKESGDEMEKQLRKVSAEAGRLSLSLRDSVKATRDYNEKLEEETERIGEKLNQVLAGLLGSLAEKAHEAISSVGFDHIHGELKRAVDAHVGAVSLAGGSMERTERSVNEIAAGFAHASASLSQTAAAFRKAMEDADWHRVGEMFRELSERVEGAGAAFGRMVEEEQRYMNAAAEDIKRLEEVRANFSQAMAQMKSDIDAVGDIRRRYRETFDEAATEALNETHQLYARLISGANIAIANIERLGTMADNLEKIAGGKEKEGGGNAH